MVDRITELTQRIEELTERLTRLAADPTADPSDATKLLDALGKAERDRRRVLQQNIRHTSKETASTRRYSLQTVPNRLEPEQSHLDPVMPMRERALAGLELLGVPSRGGLVAVAAAARTGLTIEPRQFASLRRSELASWRAAPDRRPAYVLPALHDRRFEPLRGVLASSAWEPWRRIVGPLSARADHLRAAIRVAEHIGWAREHSAEVSARLERLLWRLGRSIPGIHSAADLELERVIAAAQAELSVVDEEDRGHREAAAARLVRLSAEQQLFGAGLTVLAGGEATR
jgi:hypothetical protein